MEHIDGAAAAYLVAHDAWGVCEFVPGRTHCSCHISEDDDLGGQRPVHCRQRDHDGYDEYWGTVYWSSDSGPCQWSVYDVRAVVYPGETNPKCHWTAWDLTPQECSPARYRGFLISSFQIFTTVSNLVGTIVDNFTAKIVGRNAYLIPLGLIYVLPVVISVGLLFVPESPRWLAQHDHQDAARKALRWLRPGTEAEIDTELHDITAALDLEIAREKSIAVWDMFRDPIDRRRTILAVCALTVQGSSGSMFIIGKVAISPWCDRC